MDILIALFVGLLIGLISGCVLMKLIFKPKNAGILRLYDSEPDGEVQLYVELNEPPETLLHCEYVNFKVMTVNI